MPLRLWRSFQLRSDLDRPEVMRLLKQSIPGSTRCPDLIGDVPYFCGTIQVAAGTFQFQRNTYPRWRAMWPLLQGNVVEDNQGSIIQASVAPNALFWLGMTPAALALLCIPFGLLSWLLRATGSPSDLFGFVVIPLMAVAAMWWIWVPLLVTTYSGLSRYEKELNMVFDQMAERTNDGIFILDIPETPRQQEIKRQLRTKAARNGMKGLALVIGCMGGLLLAAGAVGIATERITFHARRSHVQPHRQGVAAVPRGVTLTGAEAVAASQGALALGLGLVLAGSVCGLLSRGPPQDRSKWPPLETTLLAISTLLLVTGVVFAVKSFW